MSELSNAVIGAGRMGAFHIETLEKIEATHLVAIAEPAESLARERIGRRPIAWFADYRDMVTRRDVDAVCICTPSNRHAEIALHAIAAGKHVFVEKPIATTLQDGLRIAGEPDRAVHACTIEHGGDHRLAMTFAVVSLFANAAVTIPQPEIVAVSYPDFFEHLQQLTYSLDAENAQMHHLLLQRSDGEFFLILWQEVQSYDYQKQQDIAISSQPVTLTLDHYVRNINTYEPAVQAQPLRVYAHATRILLDVPDHPLVVQITPQ